MSGKPGWGKPELQRFHDSIQPVTESGCWVWMGHCHKGYGYFRTSPTWKWMRAHRYSYNLYKGQIPDGKCLDHLCRVRCCVNPDHLEPVSNKENLMRGNSLSAMNSRKTHCIRGHELRGDNVKIISTPRKTMRVCLRCREELCERRKEERRS